MPLHLTKIAFGCDRLSLLQTRLAARGSEARLTTRYRPKRAAELAGGSLYWIIANQLVARSPILDFADADAGRTDIIIAATAIPVMPTPRRVHQGWRYLTQDDAPADLSGADGAVLSAMPDDLRQSLAQLGLI